MKKQIVVLCIAVFATLPSFVARATEDGAYSPSPTAKSIVEEATSAEPRELENPYAPATERNQDCDGPYSVPSGTEACAPSLCGPCWSAGYDLRYEAVPHTEKIKVKKLKTFYRPETRTRLVQKVITVPETRNVTVPRPVIEKQTVTQYRTEERCVSVERTVCVPDPCDPCREIPQTQTCCERRCVCVPYQCEVEVRRCVPEVVQQTVNVPKCITVEEHYTVQVPYTVCVEEEENVTVNDFLAKPVPRPCPPAPTCAPGPVCLPDSCPPPTYRPLPPPPCGVYGAACPPPAPSVLQPWAPSCPPPCRTCPILDFFEAIGDGLAELFTPCPPQPCYCPPKPCCGAGPRSPY